MRRLAGGTAGLRRVHLDYLTKLRDAPDILSSPAPEPGIDRNRFRYKLEKVWYRLMHLCVAILLTWTCIAAGDTRIDVDSAVVATDTTLSTAPIDSSQIALEPAWAWIRWPSIDAAVTLGPLDGPQDILEKEEIVADRTDALTDAAKHLDSLAAAWRARHLATVTQLEVLEDLADVHLGGDLEFQQRIEAVRQDIRQADRRTAVLTRTRAVLADEVARLRVLSKAYQQRATRLRQEEEGRR